ncbi:MAG: division/cell wall cluster transcriptional repressor MraZ [Propionibacteriaceae bacterium]|jgi:MraZ protein|nr:division/cell wall cluster transcriptional repressor MraZ [Propionibacteriaceae bacterium]
MFLGTFTPKFDEKGRFFLPSKFREALADGLVITRQPDRCLAIWPTDVFKAEVARSVTGPSSKEETRAFQRMVSAGASDESADGQGRVTVPQSLRSYARLKREIVVIGAYNRLEIWDPQAWEEYQSAQEEDFAVIDKDGSGAD